MSNINNYIKLIIIFAAVSVFWACDDDENTTQANITGTWLGDKLLGDGTYLWLNFDGEGKLIIKNYDGVKFDSDTYNGLYSFKSNVLEITQEEIGNNPGIFNVVFSDSTMKLTSNVNNIEKWKSVDATYKRQ